VAMKVAMRALGFEVKKADVLKVMKEYDKEATGKITFDDFYEVSKYKKTVKQLPSNFSKIFTLL
jgi:Ca2+-binding EF-hand superfamily protein